MGVLFEFDSPQTGPDIWSADPSRPEERRAVVASPLHEHNPEFSPDGRWVAYGSEGENLYVARSPDLTAHSLVAQTSAKARWSASPSCGSHERRRVDDLTSARAAL
jgi:Tol biopolymer transport system component